MLGAAISRLASIDGMTVKCYSLDLESDLLQEQPYTETSWTAAGTEKWTPGMHDSFSMVRYRPGGPPAVRNLEWIYGLPSNSPQQPAEADRGSLLAIRSIQMLGETSHREMTEGARSGHIGEPAG